MSKEETTQLVARVDDKIPFGRSVILGLQHVLSMDLYIMPLILGALSACREGNSRFSYK